jgi:hypothetical protein
MDRVVVAVIDSGVEVASSAVGAALWTNAAEVAGDGIDNDGNGAWCRVCQTACLSAAQACMHHCMIWCMWIGRTMVAGHSVLDATWCADVCIVTKLASIN